MPVRMEDWPRPSRFSLRLIWVSLVWRVIRAWRFVIQAIQANLGMKDKAQSVAAKPELNRRKQSERRDDLYFIRASWRRLLRFRGRLHGRTCGWWNGGTGRSSPVRGSGG